MTNKEIINEVFCKLNNLNNKLKNINNEIEKKEILWEINIYKLLLTAFDDISKLKFYQNKEKRKLEILTAIFTRTDLLTAKTVEEVKRRYLIFFNFFAWLKDF